QIGALAWRARPVADFSSSDDEIIHGGSPLTDYVRVLRCSSLHRVLAKEVPDPLRRGLGPMMLAIVLAILHLDAVAALPMPLAWIVTLRTALVLVDPRVALLVGLLDFDERILAPVMDDHRHTATRRARGCHPSAAHRRDRRETIRHRAPQNVAEEG